jgi:hypothetical protein
MTVTWRSPSSSSSAIAHKVQVYWAMKVTGRDPKLPRNPTDHEIVTAERKLIREAQRIRAHDAEGE